MKSYQHFVEPFRWVLSSVTVSLTELWNRPMCQVLIFCYQRLISNLWPCFDSRPVWSSVRSTTTEPTTSSAMGCLGSKEQRGRLRLILFLMLTAIYFLVSFHTLSSISLLSRTREGLKVDELQTSSSSRSWFRALSGSSWSFNFQMSVLVHI